MCDEYFFYQFYFDPRLNLNAKSLISKAGEGFLIFKKGFEKLVGGKDKPLPVSFFHFHFLFFNFNAKKWLEKGVPVKNSEVGKSFSKFKFC